MDQTTAPPASIHDDQVPVEHSCHCYHCTPVLRQVADEVAASRSGKVIFFWQEQDPAENSFESGSHVLNTYLCILTNKQEVLFAGIPKPIDELTVEECNAALGWVPDGGVFPPLPDTPKLAIYSNDDDDDEEEENPNETAVHIKEPNLIAMYACCCPHLRIQAFLSEALLLQHLAQHPHPNIIRFHGVRINRGHITGLALEKHQHDLWSHIHHGLPLPKPRVFMQRLTSAISHFHSLGYAYNDLKPNNIMVSRRGMPVLIDFDVAAPIGEPIASGGTEGWVLDMDAHTHSDTAHDFYALNKIYMWLREVLDEQERASKVPDR